MLDHRSKTLYDRQFGPTPRPPRLHISAMAASALAVCMFLFVIWRISRVPDLPQPQPDVPVRQASTVAPTVVMKPTVAEVPPVPPEPIVPPSPPVPAFPDLLAAPFTPREAQDRQQQWAQRLQTPAQLTNSVGMQLALIAPGTFQMGSPSDEPNRDQDEPLHEVTISRPFFMSRCEVTVQQFRRFAEQAGYRSDAEQNDNGYRTKRRASSFRARVIRGRIPVFRKRTIIR